MGSAVSLQHQDAGLIPGPAQWVERSGTVPAAAQSQLQVGSDPGNSMCFWEAKKGGKKRNDYVF